MANRKTKQVRATKRSKPQRREQNYGSFVVELWTGQTARFHDMPRANSWAQERLQGQEAGAYAAFYRAPVARGRHDTGAPWTEPFYVLIVNEYGRIIAADRTNWPNIPPKQEMFPYRGASEHVAAHREPADEHAATELVLYIENTSDLSPDGPSGQGREILKNALRKWRKGTYDSEKAVRLFEYLAEAGAKRYAKEFDSEKNWSTMFNPATRHEAAKQLEASFRSSAEHGEYDHVDTRIGVHEGVEDRSYIRLYKVIAQGNVITHLGRTTFSKTQAEDLANDLRRRGYGDVRIEPWDPKHFSENTPAREMRAERKYRMSYGELPSFEQFEHDVHTRIDPDYDRPYWPPGTLFPMELVSSHEIELAETFGLEEFEAERQRTGRNTRVRGFQDNERAIYEFLEFLIDRWNNGDEEAGDLASSIMSTLGYEWI